MIRCSCPVFHPEGYHGHSRTGGFFFEGWYYKLVDRTETRLYSVIPGIFRTREAEGNHAFVQVLDGMTGRTVYRRYPVDQFWAARGELDVRIGPSRFGLDSLSLDIGSGELGMAGELHFDRVKPWPVTLLSPGIMGWYAYVPRMECYHGVLSLDHEIRGTLRIEGEPIDFTGGRGYMEKDWGVAFPAAWVWLQTNHFDEPEISLTGSIAMIPWIRRAFRGFIVGLWHQGTLYRFATYTGAETEKLELSDTHVSWVMRDRSHRLEILASRAGGGLLHGPSRTEMRQRVLETLRATVSVRLTSLRDRETVIFAGEGRNAGMEVSGDLPTLLQG